MANVDAEARARLAERHTFDDGYFWELDYAGEHRLIDVVNDRTTGWQGALALACIDDRFVIPEIYKGLNIPVRRLIQCQRLPTVDTVTVNLGRTPLAPISERRIYDDGYAWEKDELGNHRLFNTETGATTRLLKQRDFAVLGDRIVVPEAFQGQGVATRSLMIWKALTTVDQRFNL